MESYLASIVGGYSLYSVLIFAVVVIAALYIDLHSHRTDEPISLKNAAIWSCVWVAISFVFAGYLWYQYDVEKASLFTAGYILEKSLAVDNLFVFMAIFASFGIRNAYQHRILYFGIVGAVVLRFLFIGFGTGLAMLSKWVLLVFGIVVLVSAFLMWKNMGGDDDDNEDFTNHWSVVYTKKLFGKHVYHELDGHNLFTGKPGYWAVTPLFLCLVCIEFSDVMFAFDSVPAVIAITREPFLVFTSNIFAILGLRSMYFLLAAAKNMLCHLEKAVIVVLVFIGLKMIADVFGVIHVSPMISLAVVFSVLGLGIFSSVVFPEKEAEAEA